jgi:exosome complex RNA-binding protein Csl4
MKIKLKTLGHFYDIIFAYCGNCDKCIEQGHYYKEWNYCPYCGEKIDWEDEDEDN